MIDVRPWSIRALKDLFVEKSTASIARVEDKLHSQYFENYFGHADIDAKRIVVEDDYIDRDYLEDYASYYVRCFADYERRCCRLHFFSVEFEASDLERLIVGEQAAISEEDLRARYLGFIVVKRLPQTVIGRTCLRPYGDDGGRRKYPITRNYPVSLYGIRLSVNTLGFQEQDSVAGACATSALWTILQGTGRTFQHAIPSPAEISNLADHHRALEARRAPSRGLTDEQALTVIRAVELEPLQIAVGDRYSFQSSVYAYLRGNIPLYLGVQLWNVRRSGVNSLDIEASSTSPVGGSGLHAVAITGLSIGGASELPQGSFRLRATRVDKIYAHDDQVGPFARMEALEFNVTKAGAPTVQLFALTTSFPSDLAGHVVVAVPQTLIVPLYHKIRIPYSFVQEALLQFDAAMKVALVGSGAVTYDNDRFTWDISLVTGPSYVAFQRTRNDLHRAQRLALASRPLPRFYWQASLYYDGRPVMTILFDATDLEQGNVVVHILEEDEAFCETARVVAGQPFLKASQELKAGWRIWDWFNRNPQP